MSADLLLQYAGLNLLVLSQTEWFWWRLAGGANIPILTKLEENLRISEADRWLAWRTGQARPAPWKWWRVRFLNSHSGKLNVSDINKSLTIVWLKLSQLRRKEVTLSSRESIDSIVGNKSSENFTLNCPVSQSGQLESLLCLEDSHNRRQNFSRLEGPEKDWLCFQSSHDPRRLVASGGCWLLYNNYQVHIYTNSSFFSNDFPSQLI